MNRAVFLDRDGVITREPPHYAHRLDQMSLIPRVGDAIRLLNENGFKTIIFSNQSGIGRGYYGEEDVEIFNGAMKEDLAEDDAYIDAVYICPHHPEADCDCRKPKPGMLLKAGNDLEIDLKQSFMVGDKLSDVEAGERAGCQTLMVPTGYGKQESQNIQIEHGYIANDLYGAVKHILHLSQLEVGE